MPFVCAYGKLIPATERPLRRSERDPWRSERAGLLERVRVIRIWQNRFQ